MPTKRRRRTRCLVEQFSPCIRAYLETGDHTGELDLFTMHEPEFRAAWVALRENILADWILARPGTRPWAWWAFEAPTAQVFAKNRPADGKKVAQRLRLGGVGTPSHEVLNYAPWFRFGLPVSWADAWSVAYYNGRARDVHGNRIGEEYHEGDFAAVAPNPNDPPAFESQAAYLDRHGLLTEAERRRLPVDAFTPERIDVIEDDSPITTPSRSLEVH